MPRVLFFSIPMVLAVCLGAGALTVSGDSVNGALETVKPRLNSLTPMSESSLEVSFSEPMLEPGVTTPDNYSVFDYGAGTLTMHPTEVTGSEPYTLTWLSGEMYTTTVTVTATGLRDAVGNPIDLSHDSASWIGGAPIPLYTWPLALTLLAAGLLVLSRRRNRAGALLLLVLAALIAAPVAFAQATTVTSVAFTQGPYAGGTQVDITYDLGGTVPCAISVLFSKDGGATFPFSLPLAHLSGDVGAGVTPGTKHIAWNIAADCPNEDMPYARIRVTANDASGPKEITILLPGGVQLVLVRIPAGTFQIGSPDTERSRNFNEGPVHTVTIAYDFYMGKYELTQAQWIAVMGSWPGIAPDSIYGVGDNYPAYYISWDDARNFVTALNAHITATSQGPATMRLPSEAEWEYA